MVGVEYHGDTVRGGDCTNVVSGGDGTSYRRLLVAVRQTFTPKKGGASLRGLENDWSFNVASTLESRNNCGRRGNILNDTFRIKVGSKNDFLTYESLRK